jgi:hypothetical protein
MYRQSSKANGAKEKWPPKSHRDLNQPGPGSSCRVLRDRETIGRRLRYSKSLVPRSPCKDHNKPPENSFLKRENPPVVNRRASRGQLHLLFPLVLVIGLVMPSVGLRRGGVRPILPRRLHSYRSSHPPRPPEQQRRKGQKPRASRH